MVIAWRGSLGSRQAATGAGASTAHYVRFTVSDGLHQVSATTTLLIASGNQVPTLAPPGARTATQGQPMRLMDHPGGDAILPRTRPANSSSSATFKSETAQ